jgi:hypothetical protein
MRMDCLILSTSALSTTLFTWATLIKFWNSLAALQTAAVISALVLAVGAVIEYWHKINLLALLILKWVLRKSTQLDRCVFRKLALHSIGPILVVLGIAGEFVFEGRTFWVEDKQEEAFQRQVGSLSQTATEAEQKAQLAIDKSNAADAKASDVLDTLGPRSNLLEKNKAAFINALKRFPKQPIFIVSCENEYRDGSREPSDLIDKLIAFLGPKGAGWDVKPTIDAIQNTTRDDCPVRILSNPPGVGGIVLVLSMTQQGVAKRTASAQKLQDALNSIRITTSTAPITRVFITEDNADLDSFWKKSVEDNPEAIFLLVGSNPL